MRKRYDFMKALRRTGRRLAFTGIHVIDRAIFPRMTETGVFPIARTYLQLAGEAGGSTQARGRAARLREES